MEDKYVCRCLILDDSEALIVSTLLSVILGLTTSIRNEKDSSFSPGSLTWKRLHRH